MTKMYPSLRGSFVLLGIALLLLLAPGAANAAEKVVVDATVAGTPSVGALITGNVAIQINDGSTLQSVTWKQIHGAKARITRVNATRVRIRLAGVIAYRNQLIAMTAHPPFTEAADEPVEIDALPDRFQVLGINPYTVEETALVEFQVTVKTTSGTYTDTVDVTTTGLPYKTTTGLENVPVKVPVVLYGKTQASYDWTLDAPANSAATLDLRVPQVPVFTPDVAGIYKVSATNLETGDPEEFTFYAGFWRGVIVGEDADGLPIADTSCTVCHTSLAEDKFTPWRETGHAMIFKQNVETPNGHYGESCLGCHTVGFDLTAANQGADDAPDYENFVASGLMHDTAPGNFAKILDEFPNFAKKSNIQCENCHGPQVIANDDTPAHGLREPAGSPRVSVSSNVCAPCHGEPTRHARFQQWQMSGHGNYELAKEEGTSNDCGRCHSAQGFLTWLPILLGDKPGDPTAALPASAVTWNEETVQPQSCVTCHDPHAIGTTTGVATNATVRLSGDTPPLLAGFKAVSVGAGALCMTCHNSRRGLFNDSINVSLSNKSRAPHPGVQGDVLMSQNAFLVNVGVRGRHSFVEDTCVACHMEKTIPPAYVQGTSGTNHTMLASTDICNKCHVGIDVKNLQHSFDAMIEDLAEGIAAQVKSEFAHQIAAGNKVTLTDSGVTKTITNISQVASIAPADWHGRQGVAVTFADGTTFTAAMNSVKFVAPDASSLEFYAAANPTYSPNLYKAFWNLLLIESDASRGVHNPTWVLEVLDASREAIGAIGVGEPMVARPSLYAPLK